MEKIIAFLFVCYCAPLLFGVAFASPQDVDRKAAEAIDKISTKACEIVVDEVEDIASPLGIAKLAISKIEDNR